MNLSNLTSQPGARKGRKRIGRGESSGWGKTAGKGHKGQKARSGKTVKPGCEGGQMPLMRRIPKFGFKNFSRKEVSIVNLKDLHVFADGDTVELATLKEKGLIRSKFMGQVKVLGNGEIQKKVTIKVDRISASAKAAIEKAGGTISLLSTDTPAETSAPQEEQK